MYAMSGKSPQNADVLQQGCTSAIYFQHQGHALHTTAMHCFRFLNKDCVPAYTLFTGSHSRKIGYVHTNVFMQQPFVFYVF